MIWYRPTRTAVSLDRISELVSPGSSLIISDESISPETGHDTDFVVVMSGEPQGGLKIRRHNLEVSSGSDHRVPRYGSYYGTPFGYYYGGNYYGRSGTPSGYYYGGNYGGRSPFNFSATTISDRAWSDLNRSGKVVLDPGHPFVETQ